MVIRYNMDYLFGGTIAYLARTAAKNASAYQELQTFEAKRAQLNAAVAAGLLNLPGRRKRLVSIC